MNTAAYIDGANLHTGISKLGWKLDYRRFRVWLKDKFKVEKAYLFIGLIPSHTKLYEKLQDAGFILIFKETIRGQNGKVKGNCDAELVLHAVSDWYENNLSKAILVSGDGDFRCLVDFLKEKKAAVRILAPSAGKCSVLLKRTHVPITYLEALKTRLGRK